VLRKSIPIPPPCCQTTDTGCNWQQEFTEKHSRMTGV